MPQSVRRLRHRPLPRGRHGLSVRAVKDSQRSRVMQAMLDRVNVQGYASTTVAGVAAAARVSPNVFYEFFSDREDCFLALCEEQSKDLLSVATAYGTGGDPLDTLRRGLRDYLRWWQQRPQFSRAYFLELPAAGGRAVAQRQAAYQLFERMFSNFADWMRKHDPQLAPTPARAPRMLVVAITETVADEVRADRTAHLPELEDDLMFLSARLLGSGAMTTRRAKVPAQGAIP